MKNLNYFLVILLLVTQFNWRCKVSQPTRIEAKAICTSGSIADKPDHIIDFPKAVTYIYNFYDRFRDMTNETGGIHYAPGWSEIDGLDYTLAERCGLLAYFCKSGETYKNYFLAYKKETNLKDDDDPYVITNPIIDFHFSDCPFHFPAGLQSASEIEPLLKLRYICNDTTLVDHDYREVNSLARDFFIKVISIDPGAMENPVGFFHDKQIKELLKQPLTAENIAPIKGIRIYWGYENGKHEKVKIIAFAVDSIGKNVYEAPSGKKVVILEHSWPPY